MMKLLGFLTDAFIAAFGISEPSPAQKKMVTRVLGGVLLVGLLFALALLGFLAWEISHGPAR